MFTNGCAALLALDQGGPPGEDEGPGVACALVVEPHRAPVGSALGGVPPLDYKLDRELVGEALTVSHRGREGAKGLGEGTDEPGEGLGLEPATLAELGRRGLRLELDIYYPDEAHPVTK